MVWHIIWANILFIVSIIPIDGSEYSYQKNRSQLQNNNFFCSGIINLLLDGLAYNTGGHFLIAHIFPHPCRAWKNTAQLVKYLRVLYAKPSDKVYIFPWLAWGPTLGGR